MPVLTELDPLFQPLTIRGRTLRNRFAMAPMTRSFCPDGLPGSDVAGYYQRRAQADVGLIVTEAIGTDHPAALGDTGLGEQDLPLFSSPCHVAAWAKVVSAVHTHGGCIIPQLWHQGPIRMPDGQVSPFSPSGHYGDPEKAAD